jgi:hypothetical protein
MPPVMWLSRSTHAPVSTLIVLPTSLMGDRRLNSLTAARLAVS